MEQMIEMDIFFKEMILDLSSIMGVLAKVVDAFISITG